MYLALKVLAFTRDFLLISAAIALAAFLILLPFGIVILFVTPGPVAAILMASWFLCLVCGLGYYVCEC
jgi:hypothetical protein